MYSTVILLTLVFLARGHDVILGTNTEGRKIYDEIRTASPTIWRQAENVTVTTTDAEIISRIVITDRRPDKDGDVKVVEGGEGQKKVIVELKSPTVLRGYDFQIQVFSVPEDKFKSGANKDVTQDPNPTRVQRNPEEDKNKPSFNPPRSNLDNINTQDSATTKITTSISADTKVNDDKTKITNEESEDVGEHKMGGGSVPFLGNRPQAFNIPATVPQSGEGNKNAQTRHARDAFDPEIPEENHSPQKKINENKDDSTKENSSTHRPLLISRQGAFNRPNPAVSLTTNKPANLNDKREARDTEHEKKSDDDSTPKENYTNVHPALVARQFNRPNVLSTTTKPENDSKRDARDTEHDKKSDSNTTPNEKSSTQHPALVARQFNRPTVVSTTNEPENDGKRDARDTEHQNKNDNIATTNENTSTQRPALIARQFNKPTIVSTTKKPESDGKRDARDTEHDNKSDSVTTSNENTSQLPAIVARQFNRPSPAATTIRSETDAKRDARDTEHEKKTDDNATPKENSSTLHPALIARQFSRPTAVSTTNKPENDGKRDARDTEHEKSEGNTALGDNFAKQHPVFVPRQLNGPSSLTPTTNKPGNVNDGKRDARDTDEKKNDNTSSKADVPNSNNNPAQPKFILDALPIVDVKTYTPSPVSGDQTTEKQNEDTNNRPQGIFVPPPGYIRVVSADPVAKDRKARDVEVEDKKPISPRLYTNAQTQDDKKTNGFTTANTKDGTSTTTKPLVNDEDSLSRLPQGIPLPRNLFSTTTVSPTTTKSQNKRETESKVSAEEKNENKDFLNVTRIFGEYNSTVSEEKPVISIQ